jgi:hypothetical protein
MKKIILFSTLLVLFLSLTVWSADSKQPKLDQEQKSAPVTKLVSPLADQVPWLSINDGGGLDLSSTNYTVGITIGQVAIGYANGTNQDAGLGFWYGACLGTTGNVNGTLPVSLPDVIHLVNYVFDKDRPATACLGSDPENCWPPLPLCSGEVNGTPPISLPDVIYLVNYVFDKDRPATACLGSDPGNCWPPVPNGACCQ